VPRHGARWIAWLLGIGLLGAVVGGAVHFSEQQSFLELAERAEPWWLAAAVLLQAGTYLAQGGIWRRVGHACGYILPVRAAFELSLAKLFADQALPSGGVSSSVLIAQALEQRRLPPPAVKASVLINIASYHLAYVVALLAAMVIMTVRGESNPLIAITAVVFLAFSMGLSAAVLWLAGRDIERLPARVRRMPVARTVLVFVAGADRRLVRSWRMLADTIALQGAIILLDAATMWILIRALGSRASMAGVFVSFMIASLFRTMGIVPGGLGTFEASSVVTLRMAGVDIATGLSATLLFRGLSFWLPMLPGYWFSRRAVAPRPVVTRSEVSRFWTLDATDIATRLRSGTDGLSSEDAAQRLTTYGRNELRAERDMSRLDVCLRQLRSPLLLLLVFAAGASLLSGEWVDAAIVLTIVIATVGVGYSREYSAQTAVAALRARVRAQATVLRDGQSTPVPAEEVVPGDVVLLAAGSLVPADAVVLAATDFFVSEAVLTGESFPAQKTPGVVAADAELVERTNCVFLGTNVRSGSARCLVVTTGPASEFGAIAHRLTLRAAGDGIRSRNQAFRLPAYQRDVRDGAARVCRAYVSRPRTRGDIALLSRAGRRPQSRAAAGDSQCESRPRRTVDGASRRARTPTERHRESREHGRAVHRQDRHAHRRRCAAGWRLRHLRTTFSGGTGARGAECRARNGHRQSARRRDHRRANA
jgi:Mg2+-importing ATPase